MGGKFMSPSGKLRKAARKSSGSTASTASGSNAAASSKASGSTGPLAFKLFGTDSEEESDDEDEDEEEEANAAAGPAGAVKGPEKMQVSALKGKLEETWKDGAIGWDNKDPVRAFNEGAPLEGFQDICGPNSSLAVKQVRVKDLGEYLICYDMNVLRGAEAHMVLLTQLWKSFKQPGRKMDLVAKTYALEVTQNATRARKPLLLLIAVLLEAKRLGVAVVDPDVMGL
jgi:hypothetical protein